MADVGFVVCMPGIANTGEPPSFVKGGAKSTDRQPFMGATRLGNGPDIDCLEIFDTQADADRWAVEWRLAYAPQIDEAAQNGVTVPDLVVLPVNELKNWEHYRG